MRDRCRLAVVATHPIHYQVELFRKLAQIPWVDLTVLFCSRFGLCRQVDHTFGKAVQWYDESILEGYPHRFLANLSWQPTPSSFFGTINPGIIREMFRGRYDAVLVQGYAGITEWLALLSAPTGRCRILFRGETTWPTPPSRGRHRLRGWLLNVLRRRVHFFLPIGSRSRAFYLQHGIPYNRLVFSPYAVDNDSLFSQAQQLRPQKERLRISLGIPARIPVVLYAGKLIPRKRPLDLVAAFERLRGPAFLLFAGEGPLRTAVEERVRERGLSNIRCVGFQRPRDLTSVYAIADIFALPSEYEPWGLTVNEAMCFSLPIITTLGVSAGDDLVAPGENGFRLEAGDIASLKETLHSLVNDPALREAMGRRSAKIIRGWSQTASLEGICRALTLEIPR